MPDPTTTYITTAAAPEWAADVTGDARDAEIARAERTIAILEAMCDKFERTRETDLRVLNSRDDEIASLKAELGGQRLAREHMQRRRDERDKQFLDLAKDLADVKAECCRLVCRNGDLYSKMYAREQSTKRLVRAAKAVLQAYETGSMTTPIGELAEALAAMGKAKEAQ